MTCVGFEPTISEFERAKTVHALDRAVTVVGTGWYCTPKLRNFGVFITLLRLLSVPSEGDCNESRYPGLLIICFIIYFPVVSLFGRFNAIQKQINRKALIFVVIQAVE
jgi:hypothetical protein